MQPDLERDGLVDHKVYPLIKCDQRKWDINKVKALFNPLIAVAILKVILSPYPHNDKQFWIKEKIRFFSIRSAYMLMTNERRLSIGESSSMQQHTKFWKQL